MTLPIHTLVDKCFSNPNEDAIVEFVRSKLCTNDMINQTNEYGWTPLQLTASMAYDKAVAALLTRGADVNYLNCHLENSLMICIVSGPNYRSIPEKMNIIDQLIEHKTDLNYQSYSTAFILACEKADPNIIQRLLNHNVNINVRDKDGNTGYDYLQASKHPAAKTATDMIECYIARQQLENNLPDSGNQPRKIKL